MSKKLFRKFLSFLFIFLTVANGAFCSIPVGDVSKLPIKDLEKYLQKTERLLKGISVEGSEQEQLEELKELLNQAILGKELTDTNIAKIASSKKKKVLYALGAILGVAIVCFLVYKVYDGRREHCDCDRPEGRGRRVPCERCKLLAEQCRDRYRLWKAQGRL